MLALLLLVGFVFVSKGDVVLLVVVNEVVVFVDSKTMPALMRLLGLCRCPDCGAPAFAPIRIGLESLLVPLIRDNNSSSNWLTPEKSSEEEGVSLSRTLKGAAEDVVCSN